MRETPLIKAIPLSFYSRELYCDAGRNWPGLGFIYALIVLSLSALPVVLWFVMQSFTVTLDQPIDANFVIRQIPEMNVKDGQLNVNVEQPYYIRSKAGLTIAIIDTTRPVSDWSQQMQGKSVMIFGKTQGMTIDANKSETRLYNYPNSPFHFNAAIAQDWCERALGYLWIFPILIALMVIPMYFVYVILRALCHGLIGLAAAKLLSAPLSYSGCVRVACVAATPTLIIEFIALATHISLGWYGFLLIMAYLFYGIWANRT